MGQRRSERSNINLDYRTMGGIRSRKTNNNNTNPLYHIQQQLYSVKTE